MFHRRITIALGLTCIALSASVSAETRSWIATTDGDFADPLNWDTVAPGNLDTVLFDLGDATSRNVDFTSDQTTQALTVRSGHVTFDGDYSYEAADQSHFLHVGDPDHIENVVELTTNLPELSARYVYVGDKNLHSTLNVVGGELRVTAAPGLATVLMVGHYGGSGLVNVTNGAQIHLEGNVPGSGMTVGGGRYPPGFGSDTSPGHGTVRVSGDGSSIAIDSDLLVGSGYGSLEITGGGHVSCNGGLGSAVGMQPSTYGGNYPAVGSALIDGEGSAWYNSSILNLGGPLSPPGTGTGSLMVCNGGVVTAAGGITHYNGVIAGDGEVIANVISYSAIAPATSLGAPATLHFTGNYTQKTVVGTPQVGTLQIDLASASSNDALDVTGDVSLAGTLEVSLVGGYTPAPGSSFDILDWTGSLTGTFDTLDLPALPGVLWWDTAQLYTTGILAVATIPADFDSNGYVDDFDLNILLGSWGTANNAQAGNLSTSGGGPIVDDFDLNVFLTHWTGGPPSSSPTPVPEPGATALLLATGMVLGLRRQRGE